MGQILRADLSGIAEQFSSPVDLSTCKREACPAFMEYRFATLRDFDPEACSKKLAKSAPELVELGCGLAKLALPAFIKKENT